eukprot:366092-Chlamydomonas_euryale.AAC.5
MRITGRRGLVLWGEGDCYCGEGGLVLWGEGDWCRGERGIGVVGRGGLVSWGEGDWYCGEDHEGRMMEVVRRSHDVPLQVYVPPPRVWLGRLQPGMERVKCGASPRQ